MTTSPTPNTAGAPQPYPAVYPTPESEVPAYRRPWPRVLIGLLCAIAGFIFGWNAHAERTVPLGTTASGYTVTPTPSAEPVAPVAADFTLTPTVISHECVITAESCNYMIHVGLGWRPAVTPVGKWLVTFQIDGGTTPTTGSIAVNGDHWSMPETNFQFIDVPDGSKFTAHVTSVVPA